MEAASPPEEEARGQENRDLENTYALMASLPSPRLGDEDADTHPPTSAFSTTLPRLPFGDAHGASSWMSASPSAEAQVPLQYALQITTSPRDVTPPLMAA
ncbi:hypothetical protein QOT17_008369 [Balamuthia mandrillaris]